MIGIKKEAYILYIASKCVPLFRFYFDIKDPSR